MMTLKPACTPKRLLRFAPVILALAFSATPAHAVNKDMVQLQTQIQELQDAIARLQQSNDERMGVMKDVVQQTADSVNKMSVVVDTLQKQFTAQQDAPNAKLEQVSGQIQSLNDSLDELKARLAHIDKSLGDLQNQQQSISANLQNSTPANNTPPPAAPMQSAPQQQDNPAPLPAPDQPAEVIRTKPSAAIPSNTPSGNSVGAPPAEDLYKTALGDYMGARYALATAEFGDVYKFYPDNPLSGNSLFYLAEIDYRAAHYVTAIKNYDRVLDGFPGNSKIPAAHLHKGIALIAMKQNDAGIRELRALVQRFPNSPESMQARSKLSGMGVPVTPRTR